MPKPTRKQKAAAAAVVGACVLAAAAFDGPSLFSDRGEASSGGQIMLRRSLALDEEERQLLDYQLQDKNQRRLQSGPVVDLVLKQQQESIESGAPVADSRGVYKWALSNLRPLTRVPDPKAETVLFWHIPKSGGSTAKAIYRCLGMSIDIESQPATILHAAQAGLVESGAVDIIFSSFPNFAIAHLFDSYHKGRVLAMFRHPVDRLISKFYYLQVATWEKTYRPDWKGMDVLDWAKTQNHDNDHMVKKLAGKIQLDKATEEDLHRAKQTVKSRFVVGLMHEMEESIHRFNTVIGLDEGEQNNARCMDQYFGHGVKKSNSNSHPKVEQNSEAYQLLAQQNSLDIQLYEYVLQLFEEQRDIIHGYRDSMAAERKQ